MRISVTFGIKLLYANGISLHAAITWWSIHCWMPPLFSNIYYQCITTSRSQSSDRYRPLHTVPFHLHRISLSIISFFNFFFFYCKHIIRNQLLACHPWSCFSNVFDLSLSIKCQFKKKNSLFNYLYWIDIIFFFAPFIGIQTRYFFKSWKKLENKQDYQFFFFSLLFITWTLKCLKGKRTNKRLTRLANSPIGIVTVNFNIIEFFLCIFS